MGPQVFISYSSHDRQVGEAACAALEGRGLRCWIAPRDILPGRSWGEAIVEGISASQVFVLIFSANANGSQQILREVERAVNRGLVIVPFRIDDVVPAGSLEYFMSVPHWLDAMTPPLERHLAKLGEVIEQLVGVGVGVGVGAGGEPVAPRAPLPLTGPIAGAAAGTDRRWWLVPALLALPPVLAGLLEIDPPWPADGFIGFVSALAILLAASVVRFQSEPLPVPFRRAMHWTIPVLAVGGLLAYLALYSLLVEQTPLGREIKGFVCQSDARLVYGGACPSLDSDALRDAGWRVDKLWTAPSLLGARMALILGWLSVIAALALAAVFVSMRRTGAGRIGSGGGK